MTMHSFLRLWAEMGAIDGGSKPAKIYLDHGRVTIQYPRLMTDDQLADISAAFVDQGTCRPVTFWQKTMSWNHWSTYWGQPRCWRESLHR
jgi:hypothetical protein